MLVFSTNQFLSPGSSFEPIGLYVFGVIILLEAMASRIAVLNEWCKTGIQNVSIMSCIHDSREDDYLNWTSCQIPPQTYTLAGCLGLPQRRDGWPN